MVTKHKSRTNTYLTEIRTGVDENNNCKELYVCFVGRSLWCEQLSYNKATDRNRTANTNKQRKIAEIAALRNWILWSRACNFSFAVENISNKTYYLFRTLIHGKQ